MSDKTKWAIIITVAAVISVTAVIVVGIIMEALSENLYIFGFLVGIPVGALVTIGVQWAIRWKRGHRIAKKEDSEKQTV